MLYEFWKYFKFFNQFIKVNNILRSFLLRQKKKKSITVINVLFKTLNDPGHCILYQCGQMADIMRDCLCLLLSLQIGWNFFYQTVKYDYTVPQSTTHVQSLTQVFLPQTASRLTWWPIKSKVQHPLLSFLVTFDINHWCPGSALQFYPQDSCDPSLTLLSETGIYITSSLGGYLLDMKLLLPRVRGVGVERKKNTEVSLTMFGICAGKGQNLQVGFFLKKRRKLCWFWSLFCFPSSQESGVQWLL